MEAKICRGSWCLGFGLEPPATLEQVVKVLSAFGYDGIELAGFFDHATVERYPDKESRRKLVDWIGEHDLEIVGYAPGPYGDFGKYPWATGSDDVVAAYESFFDAHLQFCVDMRHHVDADRPGRLRAARARRRLRPRLGPRRDDVPQARRARRRGRRDDALGARDGPDLREAVRGREALRRRRSRQPEADVRRRARRGGLRHRPQPRSAGRASRGRAARVRRDDEGPHRPHARLRHRLEHVAQRVRHAPRDRQGRHRLRRAHPGRSRFRLHEPVVVGRRDPDDRRDVGGHVERIASRSTPSSTSTCGPAERSRSDHESCSVLRARRTFASRRCRSRRSPRTRCSSRSQRAASAARTSSTTTARALSARRPARGRSCSVTSSRAGSSGWASWPARTA